jgi:hypothetical protein
MTIQRIFGEIKDHRFWQASVSSAISLNPFFNFVNIEDFFWALNLLNSLQDVGH